GAASKPPPFEYLRNAAQQALDQVIALRGSAELSRAVSDADALAAVQLASGFRAMAATVGSPQIFSAESLKVAEPMRRIFERLAGNLSKRGLLEKRDTDYRPTSSFAIAANAASAKLRAFISDHSGHLPEALLCAATCSDLGPILRGEKDAVQI